MKPRFAIIWFLLLFAPAAFSQPVYQYPINVDVAGLDLPAKADSPPNALLLNNCDAYRCRVVNYNGNAVTLIRPAKPLAGRADMPILSYFRAEGCGGGIVAQAVDWMIDHPMLVGSIRPATNPVGTRPVGIGIDWQQGAGACSQGQVYGWDIAGLVRKQSAKVAINGTEFSDARKGLVLLANRVKYDNGFSERCWEHNVLVGGKSCISNLDIEIEEFVEGKDWTPIAIEIVTTDPKKPHPEFGPLCGNHTKYLGGSINLLATTTTKLMTGIYVNRAHMVRIDNVSIDGPPNSIAFRAVGCDGLRASYTVTGGARNVFENLGVNNHIEIFTHNGAFSPPEIVGWFDPSNSITVNGVEFKASK